MRILATIPAFAACALLVGPVARVGVIEGALTSAPRRRLPVGARDPMRGEASLAVREVGRLEERSSLAVREVGRGRGERSL